MGAAVDHLISLQDGAPQPRPLSPSAPRAPAAFFPEQTSFPSAVDVRPSRRDKGKEKENEKEKEPLSQARGDDGRTLAEIIRELDDLKNAEQER